MISVGAAGGVYPRVAEILGGQSPLRMNARGIAALADNPACRRRAVLDVSGVDGVRLSAAAGAPAPFGQSPFAMVRGQGFEHSVLREGAQKLAVLTAKHLDVPATAFEVVDLGDEAAGDLLRRAARTKVMVDRLLAGPGSPLLVVHPVLTLPFPGASSPVYLEPDALAVMVDGAGRIVCVEIKSRPTVDGVVDPATAASAARQIAVYVIALRALLTGLDGDPARVSADALLVTPWNASNRAVAHPMNVGPRIASLTRQLDRLAQMGHIPESLPDGFTLDTEAIFRRLGSDISGPVREAAVSREIRRIPANYLPGCRSSCAMGEFCRRDAMRAGDPSLLGGAVRDGLAGITDLYSAARIARTPSAAGVSVHEEKVRYAAFVDEAARAEPA